MDINNNEKIKLIHNILKTRPYYKKLNKEYENSNTTYLNILRNLYKHPQTYLIFILLYDDGLSPKEIMFNLKISRKTYQTQKKHINKEVQIYAINNIK